MTGNHSVFPPDMGRGIDIMYLCEGGIWYKKQRTNIDMGVNLRPPVNVRPLFDDSTKVRISFCRI